MRINYNFKSDKILPQSGKIITYMILFKTSECCENFKSATQPLNMDIQPVNDATTSIKIYTFVASLAFKMT